MPTPSDAYLEQKPKPTFPRDPQLLQAMRQAAARLCANSLPEPDLVVTFDEILAGAAGVIEQQAALAMLQDTGSTRPVSHGAWTCAPAHPTQAIPEETTVALVYVDDGGMAPSTAISSWKQNTLHNMTVTLRGTGTGTKRKVKDEGV